ncbi:hypothetical protein [Nonomuraea jabiensis]|uniref:hypothetical protein n=1 Tax=Nonomuraea jabiensis TaxID=882448 RepID=UPI003F4E14EE
MADAAAPPDQISDPVTALRAALPLDLPSPPKGELAIGLLADAYAAGVRFGFIAGDEVYGACIKLRALLEQHQQAYVLRVRSSFTLTLDGGTTRDLPTGRCPALQAEMCLEHPRASVLPPPSSFPESGGGDGSSGGVVVEFAGVRTGSQVGPGPAGRLVKRGSAFEGVPGLPPSLLQLACDPIALARDLLAPVAGDTAQALPGPALEVLDLVADFPTQTHRDSPSPPRHHAGQSVDPSARLL